jgi:type IV secretory pathway VirB2 component (pilin)
MLVMKTNSFSINWTGSLENLFLYFMNQSAGLIIIIFLFLKWGFRMKVFKRLILIILGILLVFECYLIFSFLQGYESTKKCSIEANDPF